MKKKLLHLQLLPILSGVQRFSLHLLDGLPPEEYEIYVASKPGGDLEGEVSRRGWHYLPLTCMVHPISPTDILSFWQLFFLFKKHRFDIVHTNSSKPGLLGRLAARLAKVPKIIHSVHGTAFQGHQSPLVQRFYMLMEKLGNALGDYTVFVNKTDRKRCLDLALVKEERSCTIHNAILPPPAPAPSEIQRAPLSDDKITIGSTLRFSDPKNVIKLITAACKSCRQNENLRFIFLGDGPHFLLCKSIVASYRLNERILLPGWDSDVEPWLRRFDLFILYSRWEAMPLSIIEAMKAGLPVIGSSLPSICELVDSDSGWLVPLDDEAALLDTLQDISKHPDQIVRKGAIARLRIDRLSDYSAMVDSYRNLYEQDELAP